MFACDLKLISCPVLGCVRVRVRTVVSVSKQFFTNVRLSSRQVHDSVADALVIDDDEDDDNDSIFSQVSTGYPESPGR